MPIARPTRPRVRDGLRATRLLRNGIAPVLGNGAGLVGGAGSWAEALARLGTWNPGSITSAVAPGFRDILADVDRQQLLRFRQSMRRFVGPRRRAMGQALDALQRVPGFDRSRATLRAIGYSERLPELFRSNLERRLAVLQAQGLAFTPERLRKAVRLSQGVVRNRARLIGFDQVETFTAELAARRQREVGIDRFQIITAADFRVRDEHAAVHGNIYSWAGPYPYVPGRPIKCRCGAAPVFD